MVSGGACRVRLAPALVGGLAAIDARIEVRDGRVAREGLRIFCAWARGERLEDEARHIRRRAGVGNLAKILWCVSTPDTTRFKLHRVSKYSRLEFVGRHFRGRWIERKPPHTMHFVQHAIATEFWNVVKKLIRDKGAQGARDKVQMRDAVYARYKTTVPDYHLYGRKLDPLAFFILRCLVIANLFWHNLCRRTPRARALRARIDRRLLLVRQRTQ